MTNQRSYVITPSNSSSLSPGTHQSIRHFSWKSYFKCYVSSKSTGMTCYQANCRLSGGTFHCLNSSQVPRCYCGGDLCTTRQLHGFCETSDRAFAAVVYLQLVYGTNCIKCIKSQGCSCEKAKYAEFGVIMSCYFEVTYGNHHGFAT